MAACCCYDAEQLRGSFTELHQVFEGVSSSHGPEWVSRADRRKKFSGSFLTRSRSGFCGGGGGGESNPVIISLLIMQGEEAYYSAAADRPLQSHATPELLRFAWLYFSQLEKWEWRRVGMALRGRDTKGQLDVGCYTNSRRTQELGKTRHP